MPNWVEGNIRFRGTRENIEGFLRNELRTGGAKRSNATTDCAPACYEDRQGNLVVQETSGCNRGFYISGTDRNYIACNMITVYLQHGEEGTLVLDNFQAACSIDPKPYVELSKTYNIDIKLVGYEGGNEFSQHIEIIHGELIANEKLEYDDWLWQADFPNLGY